MARTLAPWESIAVLERPARRGGRPAEPWSVVAVREAELVESVRTACLAVEIPLAETCATREHRAHLLKVLGWLDECLEACEQRHLGGFTHIDQPMATRLAGCLRRVATEAEDDRLMRAALAALNERAVLVTHIHDTLFLVQEVVLDLLSPKRHSLPSDVDCRGRATYVRLDPLTRLDVQRQYRQRPRWMGAPAA